MFCFFSCSIYISHSLLRYYREKIPQSFLFKLSEIEFCLAISILSDVKYFDRFHEKLANIFQKITEQKYFISKISWTFIQYFYDIIKLPFQVLSKLPLAKMASGGRRFSLSMCLHLSPLCQQWYFYRHPSFSYSRLCTWSLRFKCHFYSSASIDCVFASHACSGRSHPDITKCSGSD